MSTRWTKVIRDTWHKRSRTIFAMLAIALGVAAFASVLASWSILTRALDEGYDATNPASATLVVSGVTPEMLAIVKRDEAVREVELRGVMTGKIRTGAARWRALRLSVVADFNDVRISRVTKQQGSWPPAAGEVLIERDAMSVARRRIGESALIRTAAGSEIPLRVAGTVHDAGMAQARMENVVYGYVTRETASLLGQRDTAARILIVTKDATSERSIRLVANRLRDAIESAGGTIRRIEVPPPGEHPHAAIMGTLLLSKASFGLLALLLSGALVVNLISALMASQIRQIGIMKAIGARRRDVATIYLGEALILGAGSLAIAVPAAIWGTVTLSRAQAGLLNFDIVSWAVPWWIPLLAIAAALAVPLASAAVPVWRASGIPVLRAIDDHGVTRTAFGRSAIDRLVAGIEGLSRPLLLSIRNAFRRRRRLALTIVTMSTGGVLLMAGLNVRASFVEALDRLFATRKFDVAVTLAGVEPVEKIQDALSGIEEVARVEGWITTEGSLVNGGAQARSSPRAQSMHGGGDEHGEGRFNVVAVPEETPLLALDTVQGRSLRRGDRNAIVVNTALTARHPSMRVGNEVSLRLGHAPSTWTIAGIANEPFSPATAYVSREWLEELGAPPGTTNSIRIQLRGRTAAQPRDVEEELDRRLNAVGVRAVASITSADSRFGFDQHMLMIYVFLIIVAVVFGGVGALGLATTMSIAVRERRREIGVLRAIGATPREIRTLFVTEGAVVGLASWLVATFMAWPLSSYLGDLLGRRMNTLLPSVFDARGIWIWLAASIAAGALASFAATWGALRSSVREAIAYE